MRKKVLLTTVISTSLLLAACSSSTISVKNETVTLPSTTEETQVIETEAEDEMVMTTAASTEDETIAQVEETTAVDHGELKAYQQDCFDGIKYGYDYDDNGSTIPLSKSFRDYLDSICWIINAVDTSEYVCGPDGDNVYYDGWAFMILPGQGSHTDENTIYDIMRHVGEEFGIPVTDASFDWRSFLRKNKDSIVMDKPDNFEEFIESPMMFSGGGYMLITPYSVFTSFVNANNDYIPWGVIFSINNDGSCYARTGIGV